MSIRPPVKWWGGKHYLQEWIVGLMPPAWKCRHTRGQDHIFVETHGGMGSVILNKPACDVEVFNDICLSVWNLFDVLKSHSQDFARMIALTPYHQEEFDRACVTHESVGVEAAVTFYAKMRQSFGGSGGCFSYTKFRSRKGMADVVSAWLSSIEENLPAVISRLSEIQHIRNDDGLKVIRDFDSERTLFYIDCPYLHETRATTGEYQHEMDRHDHVELLTELKTIKGRFMLSGYHSSLYDGNAVAQGWRCHEKQINNHAAGGKTKRVMTECVWTNF